MKYKDPITGEYKELFLKASDTLPIGTIVTYGSNDIPANWLLCDGRAVSRTTYANLFSAIGTNFGEGDGTTTFNLPDFRGKVPEQVVNYIIKSAMSVGVIGSVLNNKSDSNKDTYSCNYLNNAIKEVYSTEERVIGTWIDGKPLYRKVIQDTLPSSISTWKTIFKGNIKSVISYNGELYFSDTETKLIPYATTNGTIWFQYIKNGDLQVAHNNESFNNKSFTLTILYTKTTDSEITN